MPSEQFASSSTPLQASSSRQKATPSKRPRLVLTGDDGSSHFIFAFAPNRDTLGGTAYLIVETEGNILVDCPAWDETTQTFLQTQGVRWLVITHRGGMGKVREIQQALGCEVVIQEQEAYLLPGLAVTVFQKELSLHDRSRLIWTSGHSPGAACLYHQAGGGVLFSGRHLLPDRQGNPAPLRTAKTFHWVRQIRSVQTLLDQFTPSTLRSLCPGANTGFLRGNLTIADPYPKLAQLDLQACLKIQPIL